MMPDCFQNLLNARELMSLSSIVQIGDAVYRELMESQHSIFRHPFFTDTRGRIRTKLVQIQCELESHDPKFPFQFYQREFRYKQFIPELRTRSLILHIGRSFAPNILPYASKYKKALSFNNEALCRQLTWDFEQTPPYSPEPFYGILVFGGRAETFSVIQFPEPGYKGIAETINIPNLSIISQPTENRTFERKKAALKQEFLVQNENGAFINHDK